jgi:hypothetical protein
MNGVHQVEWKMIISSIHVKYINKIYNVSQNVFKIFIVSKCI